MPSLTFVLPHWLYWLILMLLPLAAMALLRLTRGKAQTEQASKPIAYFLLLTGGFVGCHRFYLKSLKGLLYAPLFIGILLCNIEGRSARDQFSLASNEVMSAEFKVERFQQQLDQGREGAQQRLTKANNRLTGAADSLRIAVQQQQRWDGYTKILAALIVLMLAVDGCLIPRLCRAYCRQHPLSAMKPPLIACEEIQTAKPASRNKPEIHTRFTDLVEAVNEFCGHFVAYWSLIAVFFYYYEVVARYLFNSPTNWAHESMFLMFGMQYLLAGGYVLRNNGHVRVDVFYANFSARTKAWVDIFTSVFFFIFACTLLWTGWTFFMDSFEVREVSFTEWGIQYWPVKFALPLGAALLLLQGFAWLVKDLLLLQRSGER
ncbi:MAG: TRAP transporter small permease subunit [Halopseudomonas sp.]